MFKQTEDYYRDLMLGFGSGSIYSYGCYLVSLVNGLADFGHKFTPRSFNQFLKDVDLFTGEFKNYIDVDNLGKILPAMFTSYKRVDSWLGFDTVNWYLDRNYIVLAKVSAKAIGGSGSHFVRIYDTTDNPKNTIIQDPWFGTTEPVTNNYNKYGNILSLRIFGVKKQSMPENTQEKIYTEIEMTKVREERDTNWNSYQDEITDHTKTKSLVESKQTTINNNAKSRQTYLDSLAKILWEEGEPTLSDENNIREKVEALRSLKLNNDELEVKLEKSLEQNKIDKQSYEDKLKVLNDKIEVMKTANTLKLKSMEEDYNRKLENIQSQVTKEIGKLNKVKEQYKTINRFLKWIKNILNGKKVKKNNL